MPIAIDSVERADPHGSLARVFESKYTLQQLHTRSEDKHNVQGVTYRIIKHHKPGYDYDELYRMTCDKFIRTIDSDIFEFVVSELIRKEYIELVNNKYIHIPYVVY